MSPCDSHFRFCQVESKQPDYQVERRYSEFATLREQASHWLCQNARFWCPYCRRFVNYVRCALSQSRLLATLVASTSLRKKLLNTFLRDIILLAQSRGDHRYECEAREHIPLLLEAFVRGKDDCLTSSVRLSAC